MADEERLQLRDRLGCLAGLVVMLLLMALFLGVPVLLVASGTGVQRAGRP
jgi:hypothetical protein